MTKTQLAFEAWFPTLNPTWSHADMFKRRNCGDYESIVTITAWTAWQASRKQALEEAVVKFSGLDIHCTLTAGNITNMIKGLLNE